MINVIKMKRIDYEHNHGNGQYPQRVLKEYIMYGLVWFNDIRDHLKIVMVAFVVLDLFVPVPIKVTIKSEQCAKNDD